MVLLVYSVIAPLTNFILAFNFLFLGALLRHQFLYVYPRIPDSGGKLWSYFIGIFLGCMLFAEITSEFNRLVSVFLDNVKASLT